MVQVLFIIALLLLFVFASVVALVSGAICVGTLTSDNAEHTPDFVTYLVAVCFGIVSLVAVFVSVSCVAVLI